MNEAFVVRTQDAEHPIYVAAYMQGYKGGYYGTPDLPGQGDPESGRHPSGRITRSTNFSEDVATDSLEPEKSAVEAINKSTDDSTVSGVESSQVAARAAADAALRTAAKAAIDAGDFARAAALLAMVQQEAEGTTVVDARKRFGRR